MKILENQHQRLNLALSHQQPFHRLQGTPPALGRIEPLPARLLVGNFEQSEEGLQCLSKAVVEAEELAGDLLADLPDVVAILDLEIRLEEPEDREIRSGVAVGHRARPGHEAD